MRVIAFSIISGIGGMGLGGLFTVMLGRRSPTAICYLLSFAGGVMTSVVCFGLIPEALHISGMAMTVFGLIIGVAVVLGLNRIVDMFTEVGEEHLKIHHTPEEIYHGSPLLESNRNMLRSGILMLIVIGLHNIPEGLAIGAGSSHDPQLGFMLACIIAMHNIPEGMAVGAPLLAGGIRKPVIVFLTALSGASTLIGGIFGFLFGNISDLAVALSLAIAGGAMLYVVYGEIIPQTIIMTKNRTATIVTLVGVLAGLMITQI